MTDTGKIVSKTATEYKCPYCGNNLSITEAYCTYCGRENEQAKSRIAEIKEHEGELEKVKKATGRKIDWSTTTAKLTVILILMVLIVAANVGRVVLSDLDYRYAVADAKTAADLEKNTGKYKEILDELIQSRAYLELSCMELNNSLMHSDDFDDYYSVFQCSTGYSMIYSSIMQIAEHSDYVYKDHSDEDLCSEIAEYVDGISRFSAKSGTFYTPERFEGEKGAYIEDLKKEASDFVIVYFGLEKDLDIYSYEKEELTELLIDNVRFVRAEGF